MIRFTKIALIVHMTYSFMPPQMLPTQKPANKKPAYILILKAFGDNWYILAPCFLIPLLLNLTSTAYFAAIDSYQKQHFGEELSEKEASHIVNLAFTQFIPILVMIAGNFITDWVNESVAKSVLDTDSILHLLSKKGNFYNEHSSSEISQAITNLPMDVATYIGVAEGVLTQFCNIMMKYLITARPTMFVNAFGITESKQDKVQGQAMATIAQDMGLIILTGIMSFMMLMLLKPKHPDLGSQSNIDDVLGNINAVQMLNRQKLEANKIKEEIVKQCSSKKFDNAKMLIFLMPYFPMILWGFIASKLKENPKEKFEVVSRMRNNLGTLGSLQMMAMQFGILAMHANSIATKLEVINAGETQNDKGKTSVHLHYPKIVINMPQGFKYPISKK